MRDGTSRKNHITILGLIMALGITVRLIHLGTQSFWWDEVYSANLASKSLIKVVSCFGQTPTLYHVVLHFWRILGHSDTFFRLLSVAFGIAAIPVIYALGKELFDARHGLLSAFLLAVSPFHLWYSQETRMYAMLILVSLASVLFFIRFLHQRGRWSGPWWILTTALAIYTHYYAVFIPIFQVIYFVICRRAYRSLWRHFRLSLAAIILLGIPIVTVVFLGPRFSEILTQGAGGNPFRAFSLPYTFFAFSLGFSYGPSVAELHRSTSLAAVQPYWSHLIPPTIVFFIAFASGLGWLWRRREREKLVFFLLYLFIPMAGASIISSQLNVISYNVRYVSVIFPAYLLILAHGLLSTRRRILRWLLILVILGATVISIANYYFVPRYSKEDYRSAARFISAHAQQEDIILVTHLVSFSYYYQGPVPARSFFWSHAFYRKLPEIQLSDYRRAWFVLSREWGSDPDGIVSSYMMRTFHTVQETTFANLSLSLFDLTRPGTLPPKNTEKRTRR